MTNYQKIAIGMLGLTHPEIFKPKFRSDSFRGCEPQGRPARWVRGLGFMLAALSLGSRTVPLADNSRLGRELGDLARNYYGWGDCK